MASIFQTVGAAISLSSSTSIQTKVLHLCSRRSLSERKASFVVVRCGGAKMDDGSNRIGGRADQLVTNAVAAKADTSAAATASNPGHELLLFEALREGLEEEMERDARVCVMGEDVGHYGGSYKVTKGLAEK